MQLGRSNAGKIILKKELMKNAEAVNMGVWPEKDSIKVLDGVIVINLGAERG